MNPSLRSLSTSPAGQPAGLPYPEPPASSIVRTCDCRRSSAEAPNSWRPRMDASSCHAPAGVDDGVRTSDLVMQVLGTLPEGREAELLGGEDPRAFNVLRGQLPVHLGDRRC